MKVLTLCNMGCRHTAFVIDTVVTVAHKAHCRYCEGESVILSIVSAQVLPSSVDTEVLQSTRTHRKL